MHVNFMLAFKIISAIRIIRYVHKYLGGLALIDNYVPLFFLVHTINDKFYKNYLRKQIGIHKFKGGLAISHIISLLPTIRDRF